MSTRSAGPVQEVDTSGGEVATVTWREGDPAASIAAHVSLDDALQPLHGATIRLTGTLDGAHEILMYDLSGLGLLAGRPKGGPTDRIDLFLFNRASARDYETALRSIRYVNRAPEPTPGTRTLRIDVIDATSFSDTVLEATLEVPAPDAYEFLSPDLLKGPFKRLDFDAFDYEAPPAPPFGQFIGAEIAVAPRDADLFAAEDADQFHLYRHNQSVSQVGKLGDERPVIHAPELTSGDGYWVLAERAIARPAAQTDAAFLEDDGYRLFRERQASPGSSLGETLFAKPSGSAQPAIHVDSLSDSAPVVVISDSTARRREREKTTLQDAA